jgi:ABC-type lipoprotein release transport system permease subunit
MTTFAKIAYRNILRNKYRSAITVFSIMVGFASLILIRAFVDGGHYQMVDNYTGLLTGHIQIHQEGFQKRMSLQKSIENPANIDRVLDGNRNVIEFSHRIKDYVLISSAEHSSGVMLIGVQKDKEPRVTELNERIREGTFLKDDKHIVIGKDLADYLDVRLEDKVIIMAQGYDGSLASAAYRISGLLDTASADIDKGIALITLPAAQDLLVMNGMISEIAIRVKSHEYVDRIADDIISNLRVDGLEVLTWKQISPILVQWIQFDIGFINVILLIVLLVVAFGILNTLLMGILERIREFGIMLALGTGRLQIVQMVLFESVILGITGVIAGYILGTGLSVYFAINGVNLTAFATALNDYYTGSIIYTRLSPGYMLYYGFIVLLTSVLVSVYPSWKAANLKPVEAIHHF